MIKKSFSYIGIFFLNFLSLLPLSLLYIFADLAYYVVYYIIPYRKNVVRENLRNAFPEKPAAELLAIEKEFYRHLMELVVEVVKMRSISKAEIKRRVKFSNLDQIGSVFQSGQSVLACTGHYGNWELGMMALGIALPGSGYVIYKPLNNKVYDKWFYNIRTRFGNSFVVMRQTLRALASTRNEQTMFCFAGDQTPVKDEAHYWINFLNQPTAVLLGIEKIALQTNRPIFYFKTKRIKRGYYEIDCVPLCLNPQATKGHELTDMQFSLLEKIIKEEPAYWLWSHRRWKHKPDNAG
ncbi:lipid A biosynthesis acyltransferase [Pedobacter heparinus DSM 2366]|uniref:Lipid A biosynthesis acyltransferase n=1 Tax=Pedobacter heparinus (strain ATCC 13125 / DSM 2366 / CIP 104194 / JCM 7457 / NBRC 12017 / NCIMB 9290 / NRRL B-14731 / HIM 762-3) TaxID=485917 RepID=C6XXV8_PEDHD|nr:lipid A biosynthesis acyltransferase [Pedobacter heparinus DSM 2366]